MMNKLIVVVGASGVGKTTLVRALAKTGQFETAFEEHSERPFQALFKQDKRYALANQLDYLLMRAEQERELRSGLKMGLMDGGLDLDYHGFTRLFHIRGLLTDPEFELCRRLYLHNRKLLPIPEFIIALSAPPEVVSERLASRSRINIASAEDTVMMNQFITGWLESLPQDQILYLDTTGEDENYREATKRILEMIHSRG